MSYLDGMSDQELLEVAHILLREFENRGECFQIPTDGTRNVKFVKHIHTCLFGIGLKQACDIHDYLAGTKRFV